jgi:hypothetical protein
LICRKEKYDMQGTYLFGPKNEGSVQDPVLGMILEMVTIKGQSKERKEQHRL